MSLPVSFCPCGGQYEQKIVEIRLTPRDASAPVVMRDVPQLACPVCGSRVYRAADLVIVEAIHKSSA